MDICFFFVSWWLNHVGVVWFSTFSLYTGKNQDLAGILVYAYISKEFFFKCGLLCSVLAQFIILFTIILIYMYKFKKVALLIGCSILSIIPNQYNPYHSRLFFKLVVYCFVVYKIQKSKGLKISKYIYFSWILFTHEICLLFLPFQIVYDTYYNKNIINV